LWLVDDDQSALLIEFHRQLQATRDVANALRAAQLKTMDEHVATRPIRQWAGLVAVGGIAHLRKDGANGGGL
jgi:CHAT domain-containing protein